MVFTLRHKD